eukprot:403353229
MMNISQGDYHGKQSMLSDNIDDVLAHQFTPFLVENPGDATQRVARHRQNQTISYNTISSKEKGDSSFRNKIFKNFHTKTSQLRGQSLKKNL